METRELAQAIEDAFAAGDLDAVAGHLIATLQDLSVPQDLIDAIVAPVASLRDDVLNR